MITRRQAMCSLCAAVVAAFAPIPAIAVTSPARLVGADGDSVTDDSNLIADGPCQCCRCDDDVVPASFTVSFSGEGESKTYVLHNVAKEGESPHYGYNDLSLRDGIVSFG